MPSIELTPDEWRTIAEFVQGRRTLLGLKQAAAAEIAGDGISVPVWSVLENARQENGRMSLAALAAAGRALQLPHGSWWDRVLAGDLTFDFDAELDAIQLASKMPRTSTDALRQIAAAANEEIERRS